MSHVENVILNRSILAKFRALISRRYSFFKQIHSRKMQTPFRDCIFKQKKKMNVRYTDCKPMNAFVNKLR